MNHVDIQRLLLAHDFQDPKLRAALPAPADAQKYLIWAVSRPDLKAASFLLDLGANPAIGNNRDTPADIAIRLRDMPMLDLLLSAGLDVNAFDVAGLAMLHRAIQAGSSATPIVKGLLARGANPSLASLASSDTPLMVAVKEKRLDLFEVLAQAGADPNHINDPGETALWWAASGSHDLLVAFTKYFPAVDVNSFARSGTPPLSRAQDPRSIALLVTMGANPNVRSGNSFDNGATPLMTMIGNGGTAESVVVLLSAGADPSLEDDFGNTAAAIAIRTANMGALLALYDNGQDPRMPVSRDAISPYHLAATTRVDPAIWIDTLQRLNIPVDLPARPGPICDKLAVSPLCASVTAGLPTVASLLRAAGATVTAGVVAAGINAAIQAEHARSIAQLLPADTRAAALKGADEYEAGVRDAILAANVPIDEPTTQARGGRTPLASLMLAADLPDFAKWLLEHGANPLARDVNGDTVMDLAILNGCPACASLLLKHCPAGSVDLCRLILASPDDPVSNADFVATLAALATLPAFNLATALASRDEDGNSPLLLAAATGQSALVRWLLVSGAEVDMTNHAGETPLLRAIAAQDIDSVRFLLGAGANPDARANSGQTVDDLIMASSMPPKLKRAMQDPQAPRWENDQRTLDLVLGAKPPAKTLASATSPTVATSPTLASPPPPAQPTSPPVPSRPRP